MPKVVTAVRSTLSCLLRSFFNMILAMGEIKPSNNTQAKCKTDMCRHFDAIMSNNIHWRKLPEILLIQTIYVIFTLLDHESPYHHCVQYRN